jgi:hypothetical protein
MLVDFVNKCGEKNHWEVCFTSSIVCGGILVRNMMGIGKDQEFRWRLDGHQFIVRVLDTDGLWWHINETIDLTHPDSLDKIKSFLQ